MSQIDYVYDGSTHLTLRNGLISLGKFKKIREYVKKSSSVLIYRGNKTTTKDILKHMSKKISTKEISVYVAAILVILMAVVIACNPGMDENISALKQFLGAAIELAGVASIFYLAYVFVNWIDRN